MKAIKAITLAELTNLVERRIREDLDEYTLVPVEIWQEALNHAKPAWMVDMRGNWDIVGLFPEEYQSLGRFLLTRSREFAKFATRAREWDIEDLPDQVMDWTNL